LCACHWHWQGSWQYTRIIVKATRENLPSCEFERQVLE
jgi:hypothetical protein